MKGARVPEDLGAEIEAHAEARGISESDAIRRLLRDGLRHQEREELLERVERIEAEVGRPWWRKLLGLGSDD